VFLRCFSRLFFGKVFLLVGVCILGLGMGWEDLLFGLSRKCFEIGALSSVYG